MFLAYILDLFLLSCVEVSIISIGFYARIFARRNGGH
jgi:hypothetical protein